MSAQPVAVLSPRKLRLGFIGLGWIGRKRLDAVAAVEGVEIAALADSDPGKLAAAAAFYPGAQAARELDAMLKCGLDGVVIATPNATHARQAMTCFEHGLPVFCQKPLAVSADEAQRVLAAAQAANRLLGVDFCYRRVQGMEELRRRITLGQLGEILAIDLTFHNAYGPDKPWVYDRSLSGGGALLDLGVHLLDLALWLQDAPALELVSSQLYAKGARLTGGAGAIEDMAFAQLEQENGAIVRLACSWHAHAGRDAVIGLEIFGSQGGAAWRNVGGSFYDFTLDVFNGRSAERLAAPPDEWGARALNAWIDQVRIDPAFHPDAHVYVQGARLIDQIYGA